MSHHQSTTVPHCSSIAVPRPHRTRISAIIASPQLEKISQKRRNLSRLLTPFGRHVQGSSVKRVRMTACTTKGCRNKNVTHSKFKNGFFPRTICPRRLSFSQFVVLMRTTNSEKDSLLGQLVLGKKQLSNFEQVTFFFNTL